MVTTRACVVMGVCGCGKSEIGARLAKALQGHFIEADSFHPPENVAKMAAGLPLCDEDRWGWLQALRKEMLRVQETGRMPVLACSSLKRAYRELLRGGEDGTCFVHLHGDRALIAERMAARSNHFMPTSLLDSQLCALEGLQPDECGITLDLREAPARLVEQALARIRAS